MNLRSSSTNIFNLYLIHVYMELCAVLKLYSLGQHNVSS